MYDPAYLVNAANIALLAAQVDDPKFEELVSALMKRLDTSREIVVKNIVLLAQGNIF